ncbi:MAG: EboA domain-containing protein [Planctomycetes bacterium]|nr:EboA domain-containing protein [Planctomycetota bacterium]
MIPELKHLLLSTLESNSPEGFLQWLDDKIAKSQTEAQSAVVFSTFSLIARKLKGRNEKSSEEIIIKAQQCIEGWCPCEWTLVDFARGYFLLSLKCTKEDFLNLLDKLFASADMNESISLYRLLILLPYHEELINRAEEGLRTNILPIFQAVAYHSPFPYLYLSEASWNQMILKSFFMESHIGPIYKWEARNNHILSQLLEDYCKERLAASRAVPFEIWALLEAYLHVSHYDVITRSLVQASDQAKTFLALLLHEKNFCPNELLAQLPPVQTSQSIRDFLKDNHEIY